MTDPIKINDPKAVALAKDKQRIRLERDKKDLATLLAQEEFRRYLWRHMHETCGLMRSASSPNGSVQSINIGMQDVARSLWAEVELLDPLAISMMMREHYEDNK